MFILMSPRNPFLFSFTVPWNHTYFRFLLSRLLFGKVLVCCYECDHSMFVLPLFDKGPKQFIEIIWSWVLRISFILNNTSQILLRVVGWSWNEIKSCINLLGELVQLACCIIDAFNSFNVEKQKLKCYGKGGILYRGNGLPLLSDLISGSFSCSCKLLWEGNAQKSLTMS